MEISGSRLSSMREPEPVQQSRQKQTKPTRLAWDYASEYNTTGEGLSRDITQIESTVDQVFQEVAGRDAIVTYTTNGEHGADSKHYTGEAIDLRTRDLSVANRQRAANLLRERLGDNYDVVDEGNHIHIEYDPKAASHVRGSR